MARVLEESEAREITVLYARGWSIEDLSHRYGVGWATPWRIVTGRAWTSVTGGHNISRSTARTQYRHSYIQARLDQGCDNLSLIAAELGITRQAVSKTVISKALRSATTTTISEVRD